MTLSYTTDASGQLADTAPLVAMGNQVTDTRKGMTMDRDTLRAVRDNLDTQRATLRGVLPTLADGTAPRMDVVITIRELGNAIDKLSLAIGDELPDDEN